jgi:DNA-binding HxlR family transcriptional regulator
LTTGTVNGCGNGARSGAQALALLATPVNSLIVGALADGPERQAELRRASGSPSQTTLRAHLEGLSEVGAIIKRRRNRFPGALEFELTEAGRKLLAVKDALDHWLEFAPGGPLILGSNAAKSAIKAFVEAWSTTMLRALAAGPRSLTELDRVISPLSYPALERRLGAMRLAGQVAARPVNGRGTPYAVTDWLREGVAPLTAAIRWERRHLASDSTPLTRVDTETAFLLAMPLLRLPTALSGSCRMAVEMPNGRRPHLAGVLVEAKNGRLTACTTELRGSPDAWASGSSGAWLAALIEADTDSLELGGNGRLAQALLDGLHDALFGISVRDGHAGLDAGNLIRDDGSD